MEHALFDARNSREKYLAASRYDTRTSFSRKLTRSSFLYVCHWLYLSPDLTACAVVVKSRLTHHLSSNNLFNPNQSAYCKHHSTAPALLYIHDYLINAIGSQIISCLCLLDISAAFDTIDHSILITRLSSWFAIHGSVLNWFKSYMSSRSFSVKCDNHMSSPHTCSCGVPQGSVLGPLLFIIYITP